jgi:hypothetical protein
VRAIATNSGAFWEFANGRKYLKISGSCHCGRVAQLGERVLCKHEVAGSIPVTSTKFLPKLQLIAVRALRQIAKERSVRPERFERRAVRNRKIRSVQSDEVAALEFAKRARHGFPCGPDECGNFFVR